jgi:hypothetical protein
MHGIRRWAAPFAAILITAPLFVTGCGSGGTGGGGGDYGNNDYSNEGYDEAYIEQARPDDWNYEEDMPVDDSVPDYENDYYPDEFDNGGYEPEYP